MSAEDVSPTLDGPRGVDVSPRGHILVAQANGAYGVIVHTKKHGKKFVKLGRVPGGFLAPALDMNRRGELFVLTTAGEGKGAATLYRWTKKTGQKKVANIGRYQRKDIDPFDTEGLPEDSNPYGVAALWDGSALVADAGGNDLLRVKPNGRIYTVARVKPRIVKVPEGLPDLPPGEEGEEVPPIPPPGTKVKSEAVITSVTVGRDGFWYIGELRGLPANPGKSQIWRVHPKAKNAVCNPRRPYKGMCKLYADGFTSIVALDRGKRGALYVLEISKMSWLALEARVPGAEVGGLFRLSRNGRTRELGAGELIIPGDVAVKSTHFGKHREKVYVTTPIFGPGTVKRVR